MDLYIEPHSTSGKEYSHIVVSIEPILLLEDKISDRVRISLSTTSVCLSVHLSLGFWLMVWMAMRGYGGGHHFLFYIFSSLHLLAFVLKFKLIFFTSHASVHQRVYSFFSAHSWTAYWYKNLLAHDIST